MATGDLSTAGGDAVVETAPHPRRMLEKSTKDPKPELSDGLLTALESDAALNAAWARRAGMISCLPCSAEERMAGHGYLAADRPVVARCGYQ